MSDKVCAIIGIGPGNGQALVRHFCAGGYKVAMLSRRADSFSELAEACSQATGFTCDATNEDQVRQTFAKIESELGPVSVVVYNAGAGVFTNAEEASAADFEKSWKVNVLGLLLTAKAALPQFRKHEQASLIVTGASAAWRGRANTAPFASAKAAQRSLAQSLARQFGPEKIHVAYMVVDGVVDLPRTRESMPDKPDSFFIKPEGVAELAWTLVHQPQSAWTFEADVRPFGEEW